MSVSQKHHRTPPPIPPPIPPQEQRAALDWVARRLRWERLLDEVRDTRRR